MQVYTPSDTHSQIHIATYTAICTRTRNPYTFTKHFLSNSFAAKKYSFFLFCMACSLFRYMIFVMYQVRGINL